MGNDSLDSFVKSVRALVSADEMEKALDQLRNYLYENAPDLYDESLMHSARYKRLRLDFRKGLLGREAYGVETTRLQASLLDLVEEIPKQVTSEMAPLDSENTMSADPEVLQKGVEFEKILGVNNLKQIAWIDRGLKVSRSVGRVLTPNGVGTGFLVSPTVIMTNNHVIPTQAIAAGSVIEFNYQLNSDNTSNATVRYELDAEVFKTSPKDMLDYTLVGVKSAPQKRPLEDWGVLELNPYADPVPAEHVAIIQHPNGGLKQIALTANWVIATKENFLHYTTDTMPGSSGSPVFNDSWQVIAIHHAGGIVHKSTKGNRYVNEGILMSAIEPDTGALWPR